MLSIQPFSNFIIRTPLYPLNTLSDDLDIEALRTLCQNHVIQEAIYLASKPLYIEMMKFCEDPNFKDEKVALSLLKYITRLSARCTPFGLFSGCTLGSFSNETVFSRFPLRIQRKTTIDNLLFGALITNYEEENRNEIRYFPNNSKYLVRDELRYTEYRYTNNSKQHFLSAVEHSDVLARVFTFCEEGKNTQEMIDFVYRELQEEGYEEENEEDVVTREDVEAYISELINNQILVSNLSPIVVGEKNTLEHLIDQINPGAFSALLADIKSSLNQIDGCLHADQQLHYYTSLEEKIKQYEQTDSSRTYTFQSDILIDFDQATFDYDEHRANLSDALKILNKLSSDYTENRMKSFKERFYKRYEDKMVPFAVALDTENGVKYGEGKDYDLSGFVDDIKGLIGNGTYQTNEIRLNKAERFLLKKIFDTASDCVQLELKDVEGFTENWDNVPDTFSILCSLYKDAISLKSVGGTSASCLLGRFGHLDRGIEQLIAEIYTQEEQSGKVIAEIVHLPEDRTGNILYRYNSRKYEIPYLGLSSKGLENQLLIDDLLIYVEQDQIKIKSKELNMEVIPKLSNAHNFSSPLSVPIYQFLCDLQMQKLKVSMNLEVSTLLNLLGYIPRIQYKNIILSEQQWLLTKEDILELSKKDNFHPFIKSKRIKTNFYLADGDNELYVNIKNEWSVKMFIQTVKNRDYILLKESLHDEFASQVVDTNDNHYANEVIMPYYKVKDERRRAN